MRYEQTAYVGRPELKQTFETHDRAHKSVSLRDVVYGYAFRAAFLGGMGIGGVVGLLFYWGGGSFGEAAIISILMSFAAGGLIGWYSIGEAMRLFVDEFGHEYREMGYQPVAPVVAEPVKHPQAISNAISISDLDRKIITLEVDDVAAFHQWLRDALDGGKDDVSLGKNDATRYSIGSVKWQEYFTTFLHYGWVKERKNQKPSITGKGHTVLNQYMTYHSYPPTPPNVG